MRSNLAAVGTDNRNVSCDCQRPQRSALTDPGDPLPADDLAGYYLGMKTNTKSSITLPADELKLVTTLQKKLGAKSKVEVVRRGLRLLKEATDRESLREAYRLASAATRKSNEAELAELDHLASEGLDAS